MSSTFAKRIGRQKKLVQALMCQNCGCVMIASYDRQRSHDRIGYSYCDKECMYQDKGRIYRTADEYQKKRRAWFCETYGREPWANKVCNLVYWQCRVCAKRSCSRRGLRRGVCSTACRRKQNNIDQLQRSRKKQSPKEVQCYGCDVVFTSLIRTSSDKHWCSIECRVKTERQQARHTRRERLKVPAGTLRGQVSLLAIYRKAKGMCQICSCKTVLSASHVPNRATLDHIIPLSRGGLHIEDNLQLACWRCNTEKSNMITSVRQLQLY